MNIFWINYTFICILYYLIGSIPFAFLIIKFKYKKDITSEGSGNVGTLNSYEITGSKKTGFIVLALDLMKGLLPTLTLIYLFNLQFNLIALPLILLVFGHNYSIWLKFKGGRGLATSAGIAIVINIFMLIIWCVLYLLIFKIKKNIHIANIIATVFMPVIALIPGNIIIRYNYQYSATQEYYGIFFAFWCIISLIILSKHIDPLISLLRNKNKD
jgi:glycerol-3-phosphate acyltransferase PlsY